MTKRTVYHVVPDGDEWKVEKEGGQRASARTENKVDAISTAKDLAKNSGPLSQVKIHKVDGTVQIEYTYGKDPRNIPG